MSNRAPHYLRFVRALSFVASAGGLTACASAVAPWDSGTSETNPLHDAMSDLGSVRDDSVDAGSRPGHCITRFGAAIDLVCAAGGSCSIAFGSAVQPPTCTFVDAGGTPCGSILCAQNCTCTSVADNTCECNPPVPGPLPPPDLPHTNQSRSPGGASV